jgi:hypothetical protein
LPEFFTSDASGNIVISCKTGITVDILYQEVLVYNGSSRKKAEDDCSETSFHENPVVQCINNNIHFVYGLKSGGDV